MEIDDWIAIGVGVASVVVALLAVYLSYRAQLKVIKRDRMLGEVSSLMAELTTALNAIVLSARVADISGQVETWKTVNPPSVDDANSVVNRLNKVRRQLGEPDEAVDLAGPVTRKLGEFELPIVARHTAATRHLAEHAFKESDDKITRSVVSAVMAGLPEKDRLVVFELQRKMGKMVREAKREEDCLPLADECANLERRLQKAVDR